MLNRFARAIEGIFGPTASALASTLELIAVVFLIAAVCLTALRGALALRAWRNGWERGLVVRCRRCGRPTADPESSVCPSGHPVRFPPTAARIEALRLRFGRWRRAAMAYPAVLSLGLAAGAVAGYLVLRVGRLRSPLAAIAACLAFFFVLAILYSLSQAFSPEWNGWFTRAVHGAMAGLLVLPLFLFGSLSRSFEPAPRRVIGHLWTTPTAVYLSTGGRARRVAPAANHAEAHYVEARAPGAGVLWQGLKSLRLGEVETPWKGSGGLRARWLDRWADDPGSTGLLVRGSTGVELPPNVKVSIFRERQELKFLPEP